MIQSIMNVLTPKSVFIQERTGSILVDNAIKMVVLSNRISIKKDIAPENHKLRLPHFHSMAIVHRTAAF